MVGALTLVAIVVLVVVAQAIWRMIQNARDRARFQNASAPSAALTSKAKSTPVEWVGDSPFEWTAKVGRASWTVRPTPPPRAYLFYIDDRFVERIRDWPAAWTLPPGAIADAPRAAPTPVTSANGNAPGAAPTPAAKPTEQPAPRADERIFILPASPTGLRIRYETGMEHNPGVPWGKNTLVIEGSGRVSLEMLHGGATRWESTIDANGLSDLLALARAADFPQATPDPNRDRRGLVPGSTTSRVEIEADGQSDGVSFGANTIEARYRPLFEALDTLLFQASAGTIAYQKDKFAAVIRDVKKVSA
jgi:hypothetical protein